MSYPLGFELSPTFSVGNRVHLNSAIFAYLFCGDLNGRITASGTLWLSLHTILDILIKICESFAGDFDDVFFYNSSKTERIFFFPWQLFGALNSAFKTMWK